ncbi:hypothetical protein DM860_015125 [Cuscuta australis]|uniref:Uncharacterized protein n=1 Tax=Cuscuta australis TaxID=267555 RepID=A0A328DBU0_9ASTE|nr:hypothetical protein DM860_015125 [Cuscuta australis]
MEKAEKGDGEGDEKGTWPEMEMESRAEEFRLKRIKLQRMQPGTLIPKDVKTGAGEEIRLSDPGHSSLLPVVCRGKSRASLPPPPSTRIHNRPLLPAIPPPGVSLCRNLAVSGYCA